MRITDKMIYLGKTYNLIYEDSDDFSQLPYQKCRQVYGICFCEGNLVIGYGGNKNNWGLIGGTIEPGEKFEETLIREIQEESNMQVVKYWPVGFQSALEDEKYQLRYACVVKPYGPFESDPAGGITAIKLIDPKSYKQYFDWGKIGERLISRSVQIIKKEGFWHAR
jgi:hypothetical protein